MFLSKIFKKELDPIQTELLEYGYVKDEKYNRVCKKLDKGMGYITVNKTHITITIDHKDYLEEKHHDNVWEQLEKVVPSIDNKLLLGSLGFEFVAAVIKVSQNVSANELNQLADKFYNEVLKIVLPLL